MLFPQPKQPLWTEMKEPMLTVFNEVKTAALNGESEVFHERLNALLALYEVVYPSMKIDVSSERIQKLNTRINFIDQYRMDILTDNDARQELLVLETELQTIFEGVTEDEADPSLWWVIISTGVSSSLLYPMWGGEI